MIGHNSALCTLPGRRIAGLFAQRQRLSDIHQHGLKMRAVHVHVFATLTQRKQTDKSKQRLPVSAVQTDGAQQPFCPPLRARGARQRSGRTHSPLWHPSGLPVPHARPSAPAVCLRARIKHGTATRAKRRPYRTPHQAAMQARCG